MKEKVKEFIIDTLNGGNEFEFLRFQETGYDKEEILDFVIDEWGEESICMNNLIMAVLQKAKEEFTESVENYLEKIEDENNKEDIDRIKNVGLDIDSEWYIWANGCDYGISFNVGDNDTIDLIYYYLEDLIDDINDKIGFTNINFSL